MDAGNMKHEWVKGYRNFELVMECVNELSMWDSDQTVRAFQTHNWADATPPASDAQHFTHELTSVSVQFDGGVLAVEFAGLDGPNSMREAFADLFAVLHDLGWRTAHVYHASATMPDLMGDMGAAIPGHMDLDLKPAEITDEFGMDGDGTGDDAIGLSPRLMPTPDRLSRDAILMDQMHNLGQEVDDSMPSTPPNDSRSDYGPIVLEDDPEPGRGGEGDLFAESVTIAPVHTQATRSFDPSDLDHEDGGPRVFSLSTSTGVAPHIVPSSSQSFAPAEEIANPAPESAPPGAMLVPPAPAVADQVVHIKPTAAAIPPPEGGNGVACPFSVYALGHCAFYFGPIAANSEYAQVEAFAQGYDEIVRLRPGQANPAVRWDVLAEVDPEFPWLAELLAEFLIGECHTTAFMAGRMLMAKAERADAQLRDLTQLVSGTARSAEQTQLDLVDDHLQELFGDSLHKHQDALALRLAGYLLPRNGTAFVDVRPSPATSSEAGPRFISVKELMCSASTTFVFVHVDSLDGPSVRRVSRALEQLVRALITSNRNLDLPDVQTSADVRAKDVDAIKAEMKAEVKAEVMVEVGQAINQVLQRLDAMA